MNTNHYPDQERCKKLTEIGFPDTQMRMWRFYAGGEVVIADKRIPPNEELDYVCPSVMEMLDVIPNTIKDIHNYPETFHVSRTKRVSPWFVWYGASILEPHCGAKVTADTLPNALADLIFWLHENKYLTF